MPLILNIDTATEHASVCLSQDGNVLTMEESHEQKNHGSFLQPAIKNICNSANLALTSVDAIAVTQGPGSYTGLRVGMASAKGLCYALEKPLILINTLQVMASASIKHLTSNIQLPTSNLLFCPMIDARRMEVFTAIYNISLIEVISPSAITLDENIFVNELINSTIIFSGSGSHKLKNILQHVHAQHIDVNFNASNMVSLAENAFFQKQFSNLAYSEPFYLKEFFSPAPKKQ